MSVYNNVSAKQVEARIRQPQFFAAFGNQLSVNIGLFIEHEPRALVARREQSASNCSGLLLLSFSISQSKCCNDNRLGYAALGNVRQARPTSCLFELWVLHRVLAALVVLLNRNKSVVSHTGDCKWKSLHSRLGASVKLLRLQRGSAAKWHQR